MSSSDTVTTLSRCPLLTPIQALALTASAILRTRGARKHEGAFQALFAPTLQFSFG